MDENSIAMPKMVENNITPSQERVFWDPDNALSDHSHALNVTKDSEDAGNGEAANQSLEGALFLTQNTPQDQPTPYSCVHCDTRFATSAELKQHEKTHEQRDENDKQQESEIKIIAETKRVNNFTCIKCKMHFSDAQCLEIHEFTKCGETEHQYQCQTCNLKFQEKDELKKHERIHETNDNDGEKPFSCADCKKDFSSETQLEKHRMSHTGTVPKQYGCNGCDSQFTKLEDMKNHEKIHTKFFTCKQCNIEFTKVSGLEKHKKLHHKQFGCSECDQTFKSKAELEKHEETDDNATKFSCKCGKLCDSSEDLKKHEETRKNKKTFSYTDCDKKFTAVDELKKHERVHAKLEICPEYAVGRCQFGASGKVGGTCPLSHPRKCIFQFTPRGCKKKESCSFYHQEKRPGSHADDKFVNRDSRPDGRGKHQSNSNIDLSFLDQRLDRMFGQWLQEKMDQDKNNNRGQWPRKW